MLSELGEMKFLSFDPEVQRFLGRFKDRLEGVANVCLDLLLDCLEAEPGQHDDDRDETAG